MLNYQKKLLKYGVCFDLSVIFPLTRLATQLNYSYLIPLSSKGDNLMRDIKELSKQPYTFNFSESGDLPEENVKDVCELLRAIVDTLSPSKRQKILTALPPNHAMTFEELKEKTELSTGSLHHHLKELWRAGFIDRIESHPVQYSRSESLDYMIMLAEEASRNSKSSFESFSQKHRIRVEV
jgi:DNA-binding HxlR family transcriptional regulator